MSRILPSLLLSLGLSTVASAQVSYLDFFVEAQKHNSAEATGVAAEGQFAFDTATGLLEISIKNLSGSGSYESGFLTSFGFEVPDSLSYVAGSFTQKLAPNSGTEPGGIKFAVLADYALQPFITLDIGAGTGATAKGGKTKDGLAGGYTAIFTFQFTGALLNDFNASRFFSYNSPSNPDLLLRFQGVGQKGAESDKVSWVYVPDPLSPIPEPSTYGVIAAGLLVGMVGFRRWRSGRIAASGS